MKAGNFLRISLTVTMAGVCACAHAQGIQYDKAEFITERLGTNVYVLTGSAGTDPGHLEGAGGRVGVLVGPEGILMVDASYAPLSDKLTASIRKISSSPIRFLVDIQTLLPQITADNAQAWFRLRFGKPQ